MVRIAHLTPTLAVAGVLSREDFAEAAAQGFTTIVNNRPDGEEAGQLTAGEEANLAAQAGLSYLHLPAAKYEVLEAPFIDALERTLAGLQGRVLLHCRSGLRSTIAWAAVAARAGSSIDEVVATAGAAGHDLSAVRDEIAAYARPHHGSVEPCKAAA